MHESIDTLTVHAGEQLSSHHGALSTPIYPASVYAFPDTDEAFAIHNEEKPGYYYGRLGNPTQTALESALAALESAEAALAFASGMAAISGVVLSLVRTGDHIVAPESMYSTTANFFKHLADRFEISTTFVDAASPEKYYEAANERTRIFWIETPSNPRCTITDIAAVTKFAREANAVSIVDNTFATPVNQRPIEHGADAVIHSATKYLGGHSDLTAGAVIGQKSLIENVRSTAGKLYGGNIAPQIAWLVMRGIKTLAVRMERHNANANAVAAALSTHPKVTAVHYPGLRSHPQHEVAMRQMNGASGMLGFEVADAHTAKSVLNKLKLCSLATSLGGVETLIQHSASMTHATMSPEARAAAGVTDGFIRLSVGIENAGDIISDLTNALDQA